MRDKIELLTHIDAPTRKEVLSWCRAYEAEIEALKRELSKDDRVINNTLINVHNAVKRSGECQVYYDGSFKVITNPTRIENQKGYHVGNYDQSFTRDELRDDLIFALEQVRD